MSETEDTIDDGTIDEAARHVAELLSPMGPITTRRLFGTWGLYLEDRIFGLVHDGIVYFRTNDETRVRYEEAGSQPFIYRLGDGREAVMQYHEVPPHILENADRACAWAYEAASFTP